MSQFFARALDTFPLGMLAACVAWAFVLRENPTFASSLGVRDYDDRLGDISLAAEDRARPSLWAAKMLDWVPPPGASPTHRAA